MLQSQQSKTEYSFMESAKLVKAMGEPLRALQQLENSMHSESLLDDDSVVDLTRDHNDKMKAKVSFDFRVSSYVSLSHLGTTPARKVDE